MNRRGFLKCLGAAVAAAAAPVYFDMGKNSHVYVPTGLDISEIIAYRDQMIEDIYELTAIPSIMDDHQDDAPLQYGVPGIFIVTFTIHGLKPTPHGIITF